jgi:hypothetical protein
MKLRLPFVGVSVSVGTEPFGNAMLAGRLLRGLANSGAGNVRFE